MTFSIKNITLKLSLILTTWISSSYGNVVLSYVDIDDPYACCAKPEQCSKGFFHVDFLYWRAYEGGLDQCFPTFVSDTVNRVGQITSVFKGEGKDPHFNWNPGFRIAGGYELPDCNWDLAAFWTYFHSTSRHYNGHPNMLRWHVNLDVIDLVTAYRYELNHSISFRPFGGLRGVIIDQTLHFGMVPNAITFATPLIPDLIGGRNKQYNWGIGPIFGLEADWNLKGGFGLYASGSISWLYGHANTTLINSENTVDTIDYAYIKTHTNNIMTVADVGFGINWKTNFCNDKSFSLNLGFEHHQYYDYNRMASRGDLSFDGLEIGMGIEF